jgi:thiamine pyrophosphokinase
MSGTELVLVLNGLAPSVNRLRELAAHAPVLAADGGARVCVEAGVVPLAVVGDFDSLDPASLPADWPVRLAADQSLTDFEKVARAIPGGYTRIRILGGLGLRLDHLFSNLVIAAGMPADWDVVFESETESVARVTSAKPFAADEPLDGTLSLLPLGNVTGIRTQGLCWNLADHDLGPGLGVGQSNRVVGPVRVSVAWGVLYVWTPRP